jgi:hypothetical protein
MRSKETLLIFGRLFFLHHAEPGAVTVEIRRLHVLTTGQ